MTLLTGYRDGFGRTVAPGGLGTADSGQTYTLRLTAGDFSVNGLQAVIAPTSLTQDYAGVVDLKTSDVNVTAQVAVSALPASGTIQIGLVGKWIDTNNYYRASIVITTAGAVTAQISKRVAGTLSNITLTGSAPAITVAANTFYGMRFAVVYDWVAQTNRFYMKLWSGNEPYGWNVTATDSSITGGTFAGLFGRNDSASTGISFLFETASTASEQLPFPATSDPMCYDPAVLYPRQTVVQSLAAAVDSYMGATVDPDAARAQAMPRVRVSAGPYSQLNEILQPVPFTTVEYNVGTATDLSTDATAIYLSSGMWILTAEIVVPASSIMTDGTLNFQTENTSVTFKIDNYAGFGTDFPAIGAAEQVSVLTMSSGSFTEALSFVTNASDNQTLAFTYLALSAVKISDNFT